MKVKPNITIVDYGVGNLASVAKAFMNFDVNVSISEDHNDIINADAIVLPGVGSFEAGMRGIKIRELFDSIKTFASSSKPILGICLGAQLLLEKGFEFGVHEGLGLIAGNVVKFTELCEKEKIPHVGWNKLIVPENKNWKGTIISGINSGEQVYFVHSYILKPDRKEDILAMSEYGDLSFCSVVQNGNIYGCQFHPEKSGQVGLRIINNFINLI